MTIRNPKSSVYIVTLPETKAASAKRLPYDITCNTMYTIASSYLENARIP